MRSKRTLAAVVAGLAVAGGGGAALAASSTDGDAFLDAVARHLGVTPERLEEATKAAAVEQVDAALADGRITQQQADELKERIESGGVRLHGFGLFGGPGRHVHGLGGKLEAAADYVDLTAEQLRERLADGRSLAEVAEAQGKSVEGLKQAILADAEGRLDAAVAEGALTETQADAALERLRSRIDDIVSGAFPGPRGGRSFGGPPADWPAAA